MAMKNAMTIAMLAVTLSLFCSIDKAYAAAEEKQTETHSHRFFGAVMNMFKPKTAPSSSAAPAAPSLPSGNPFSNFLGGNAGGGSSPSSLLGGSSPVSTPAATPSSSGSLCVSESSFRACIRGGGGEACVDKYKVGGGSPATTSTPFAPTTPSVGSSSMPSGSPGGCTQPAAPGFLNVNGPGYHKLKAQLTQFEGRIDAVYIDSMGKPTFGIGHLITASDPESGKRACPRGCFTTKCCLDKGGTPVSAARVEQVFPRDVQKHIAQAKAIYPNFDTLPETVQLILADMCFNLGNQLADFRNMKAGIDSKDWNRAAAAMVNSAWYKQVGRRSASLVAKMRSLASC